MFSLFLLIPVRKKNEKHIFNFLSLPTFLLKVIIRLGKIGHWLIVEIHALKAEKFHFYSGWSY